MADRVALLAYAKINLSLAVTGRREDGMHDLDTVMQSVSLANRVEVSRERETTLRCDDPLLPTDGRNTAVRAAAAFFSHTGISGGAGIFLKKEIPYQAGLGSASADAAAVLAAQDLLYGTCLGGEKLRKIAAAVGADVPFCALGGACRATGIGDLLEPLPSLTKGAFLIVKPRGGVSTPEAYRAVDALKDPVLPDGKEMAAAVAAGDLRRVGALCRNTFTGCCGVEGSGDLLEALLSCGALGASMSGSGSALFGLFSKKEEAEAALPRFSEKGLFAAVALPVDRGVRVL